WRSSVVIPSCNRFAIGISVQFQCDVDARRNQPHYESQVITLPSSIESELFEIFEPFELIPLAPHRLHHPPPETRGSPQHVAHLAPRPPRPGPRARLLRKAKGRPPPQEARPLRRVCRSPPLRLGR